MSWTLKTQGGLARRRRKEKLFRVLCASLTWTAIVLLAVLLFHICRTGIGWLDWQFLTSFPSYDPKDAGLKAALFGTIWLIAMTAAISIPVGVAAAVWLEEYAGDGRFARFLALNIQNLAGVPSIVYGILGLAVFVRALRFGQSLLAGSLTMSLLILPVIIIAAREAIRAVPPSIRQAAFALGATRWQTTRHHVLPSALPGILTGVILAISRAIGETAPLIMVGAVAYVAFVPQGPTDSFSCLPIQIYNWTERPQAAFHELAAAGIIVLLVALLAMNAIAVWIRHRFSKEPR